MPSSIDESLDGFEYPLLPTRSERRGYLCNTCSNFDIYSFSRDPFGFRGYRYSVASEAAAEGCSFCSLMIDCLTTKLRRGKWSLPNNWEQGWYIHLRVIGTTMKRDIESAGNGLMIYGLRATLAPSNFTIPRLQRILDWKRPPPTSVTIDFHAVADPGTCKGLFAPYGTSLLLICCACP
jgi:hypothetical protein